MRTRRLPSIGLALVLSIGSACVKQDRPGVGVADLKSNIVFGLNPPAAPGLTPPLDLGQFEPNDPGAPGTPPGRVLPIPDAPLCAEALATDAPEKIATNAVTSQPRVGDYRWKIRGQLTLDGQKVPLFGQFQQRQILNVTNVEESSIPVGGPALTDPITTHTFNYTMRTQLGLLGNAGFQDQQFQVKDNPIAISQSVLNFGKPIIVGEPERGITLKRTTVYAPQGGVVADFAPTPGLLLLPLPVNPGEEWDSVGVDPINASMMILQAKVIKREAIDACGTLVDGWRVSARQTFITAAGPVAADYEYVIATQLGGMLVYEHTFPPDLTDLRLPSLPVVPGLPQLPGVPALPALPNLPIPLPVTTSDVEFTIGQLQPTTVGR